jgi:hypothetical protein
MNPEVRETDTEEAETDWEVREIRLWSDIARGEIPVDNGGGICWIVGRGWTERSKVDDEDEEDDDAEDEENEEAAEEDIEEEDGEILDVFDYTLDIGLNDDGSWNVYPAPLFDEPDEFWWGSSANEIARSELDPEGVIDHLKSYGFTSAVLLDGLRSSEDSCLLNLACEIEAVLALRALGSSTGPGKK